MLTIKGQSTGLFFSNAMSVEAFVTRQKKTKRPFWRLKRQVNSSQVHKKGKKPVNKSAKRTLKTYVSKLGPGITVSN